ncbi:MAG: hypothetical protein QM702_10660 [Rubrivivax sp.]
MAAIQKLQNTSGPSVSAARNWPSLQTRRQDRRLRSLLKASTRACLSLVAQSMEVIRNRIDEIGTTEPTIQRAGRRPRAGAGAGLRETPSA